MYKRRDTVIMIAGDKRAGKDTVAAMLQSKIDNSQVLALAAPMKELLATTLGITLGELDKLKNDESTAYRGYLQRFGQEAKKFFGDYCWVNILKGKIANSPKFTTSIVSDLRLPAEVLDGALTLHIVNPRATNNDTHITENAMKGYTFNHTIVNDGDLKDLENKVDALVSTLKTTGWIR